MTDITMNKRIFRAFILAAAVILAASVALFSGVLYDYFSGIQLSQLRAMTDLTAQAVANEGEEYFDGLDLSAYRVTWIGSDGEVIYDSTSDLDEMENHLEREEISEAFSNGYGESSRYSSTLMERTIYCAKLLPDGTVIRLSVSHNTILTLLLGMARPICIIIAVILGISLALAFRLSKQIVKPLNELNLDEPLKNDVYRELTPLLRRIESQNRKIDSQRRELRQKQREFETVTESMSEGIVLIDSKGNIIGINRAARRIFGADSFQKGNGRQIIPLSCQAEIAELVGDAQVGLHTEKTAILRGRTYQLMISPVFSSETVSGSVLLAIDVTDKQSAEQMRREFAANVSHELKTPLHTIAGSAELLKSGMVGEADKADFYTRIYDESQRMIRLVEDIIHLSRLDEGAGDMKFEEVDLYSLAGETVKELDGEANLSHISLTLEGEPSLMSGIPQLLESIIYNLTDNAIKYNRYGGSVNISVKNCENSVVLVVSDTGIGIPPEHRERIFERFYRVDRSRSKLLGGTGLGLSIVKHGALIHHAKIELKSEANAGTTVTVTFPKVVSSSLNG